MQTMVSLGVDADFSLCGQIEVDADFYDAAEALLAIRRSWLTCSNAELFELGQCSIGPVWCEVKLVIKNRIVFVEISWNSPGSCSHVQSEYLSPSGFYWDRAVYLVEIVRME